MYDISDWTEQDLFQLISNSVQENIQLEYKACAAIQNTDKKKTEISKDISALANSAGGIIIYGIVEEGYLPIKIDNGFDPNEISKEWLEQIINSRIQRKIEGLLIKPIDLESTSPGKIAYAISVPQSTRAPHQAHDKRFYKRYNFESVPMEEYEIRDVSNRTNGPLLSLFFKIEDIKIPEQNNNGETLNLRQLHLMPLIENDSPVPAEYIAIHLHIDASVNNITNTGGLHKQDDIILSYNGNRKTCHSFNINHAIPNKMPIFEGHIFQLLNSPLFIDIEQDGDYYLAYTLVAPYMRESSRTTLLKLKGMNAEISSYHSTNRLKL